MLLQYTRAEIDGSRCSRIVPEAFLSSGIPQLQFDPHVGLDFHHAYVKIHADGWILAMHTCDRDYGDANATYGIVREYAITKRA